MSWQKSSWRERVYLSCSSRLYPIIEGRSREELKQLVTSRPHQEWREIRAVPAREWCHPQWVDSSHTNWQSRHAHRPTWSNNSSWRLPSHLILCCVKLTVKTNQLKYLPKELNHSCVRCNSGSKVSCSSEASGNGSGQTKRAGIWDYWSSRGEL